jgi:hypothetical protein
LTTHSGPRTLSRALVVHVLLPLVLFYGLRWLGANQFVALLAGAVIPVVGAVRDIKVERRISGVRVFLLGAMVLTVAMSFITGSARLLLIRNAWGTVALGLFLVAGLGAKRPFLFEAGKFVFDEERRQVWERNWDEHPQFRTLLRRCSLLWAVACLVDAAIRVGMATVLPVDLVPVLDDVLLVVTLGVLVLIQRVYGRGYLRRNGLRLSGVHLVPLGASR